jgi:TrmH family RNA methyltransferase
MGAIFRVKMHYVDLPELSRIVLGMGGKVYGTFLDGKNMYERELDNGAASPSVIVIGNESEGISPAMAELVSDRLYIPPYPADQPGSESLNAAIATAITVAEFRRR